MKKFILDKTNIDEVVELLKKFIGKTPKGIHYVMGKLAVSETTTSFETDNLCQKFNSSTRNSEIHVFADKRIYLILDHSPFKRCLDAVLILEGSEIIFTESGLLYILEPFFVNDKTVDRLWANIFLSDSESLFIDNFNYQEMVGLMNGLPSKTLKVYRIDYTGRIPKDILVPLYKSYMVEDIHYVPQTNSLIISGINKETNIKELVTIPKDRDWSYNKTRFASYSNIYGKDEDDGKEKTSIDYVFE